ncbi:MAG TPA: nuclear transport factor 2 family protein [Gemmatimonadales bacterium]|nr:nuclear transport factor 2 family protein [Gemmatimonadales bacterium]
MRRLLPVLLSALALPGPLGAQAASRELARQVFVAESSFAATMARRDLVAFGEFVSTEAVFFGRSALRGREAVIESWREYFEGPAAPFSWRPETVEVLPSGTLALTSGPVFAPDGTLTNTFTSVWRLEPDGKWRVIFDKGCPVEK